MPEARDALGGQRFFRHVLPRAADDVQICQATQEDWCPILFCSNTWWQRPHKQFEDVLHWSEDLPTTTPFPIPQKGCVVPICAAPPLFTQDAPEMIDADVCPTSLYHTPKSCACSLLGCSNAKEVTRWHTNFVQRGTYRHHDATVRVSYCSALARGVKWLLRKRLWKKKPWAPVAPQVVEEVHMGPERTASLEVLKIFNLVLGSGAESEDFWEQQLVPEASRRFNFSVKQLQRHHVKPHALFQAMEYHCRVKFELEAVHRPFFKPGFPTPLREEDLAIFTSSTLQQHFPHLTVVKDHWMKRLQHYDAVDEETRQVCDHMLKEPSFQGFCPYVRIVCARGEEWSAAMAAPTKHTRENRWDRVFQVLQLQLTLSRAIGDSCGSVGGILQGIAVALLEMAKQKVEKLKPEDADEIDEIATAMLSSGPKADKKSLKKTLWAADAAAKMLPSTISAWWAHLAAMEAEWLLDKHVEAHARIQRLQADWDRFCPDQPVLMLRLEGTAARLYAQQGDWSSAAMHTERCCTLAERAFGRTHNATVALRARLGDAWSRREDWDKAIAAYQEAYSVAQVSSDEKTTGRLAFELAQVLYFKGDLTGAKGYAEEAVKLLIPLDLGRSGAPGDLSGTSFEALMLLSRVYEDLCLRFLELHETEQAAVSPAMLQAKRGFMRFSLCYSKTFIDEEMPSPFTGRARSCPPTMTKAEKPDALNLCCLHSEEMQLKLQVSKLQQRSELLSSGTPVSLPATFQDFSSKGSYGHPKLCRRPCILFVRGRCEKAENCGFCHLTHVVKPPSFDKQQREFLKNLPAVDFMEVILPHIRKQVEESEVPGAVTLLQLLESEISIRGQPKRGQPQRAPRKIRYVLERMTLAGLVSLSCSTLPGRFPKIMSNELRDLRETAGMLEA
eukprot:symbB.v1.2.021247.t1/scaffold1826.1/size99691/6